MDSKEKDLCQYRISSALETLETAKWCVSNRHYKDAINRCYYAAFYAAKAVLALEAVDFKRHKDVVSYFNKHYIATGKLPKEVGKKLAHLQRKRENSWNPPSILLKRYKNIWSNTHRQSYAFSPQTTCFE